ncbi:MAG TPA: hypothetical protein VGO47_11375, partial [Chlamydiales bacterium]|nr:hypothetical protein [Chlamydiales bacterium]
MFELRIALKYLLPNPKSLSTALISLMSMTVVALVVWLVLVFLSVTVGIEKTWVSKLTSLYGPLRVSPTDEYYRSYFYQIDSYASASNHTLKTIGEKAMVALSDPYVETEDMEVPLGFSKADRDPSGMLIDPVKTAVNILDSLKEEFSGLKYQDYEISGALLKLELARAGRTSYLSQMSYLLSMQEENPLFTSLLTETLSNSLADDEVFIPKSYQS